MTSRLTTSASDSLLSVGISEVSVCEVSSSREGESLGIEQLEDHVRTVSAADCNQKFHKYRGGGMQIKIPI